MLSGIFSFLIFFVTSSWTGRLWSGASIQVHGFCSRCHLCHPPPWGSGHAHNGTDSASLLGSQLQHRRLQGNPRLMGRSIRELQCRESHRREFLKPRAKTSLWCWFLINLFCAWVGADMPLCMCRSQDSFQVCRFSASPSWVPSLGFQTWLASAFTSRTLCPTPKLYLELSGLNKSRSASWEKQALNLALRDW